jgi:hypothetical protein
MYRINFVGVELICYVSAVRSVYRGYQSTGSNSGSARGTVMVCLLMLLVIIRTIHSDRISEK